MTETDCMTGAIPRLQPQHFWVPNIESAPVHCRQRSDSVLQHLYETGTIQEAGCEEFALLSAPGQATLDFPGPFLGPLAWRGHDLRNGCEVVALDATDIGKIQRAVSLYKATGLNLGSITKDNFHLSHRLQSKLRDVSLRLHHGQGFVTLRGLDKAAFDDDHTEDSTIAFVGIAAHVCPERAVGESSGLNRAIEHIYDGRSIQMQGGASELPPTKLPSSMHFHADRFNGDVLAMYVRHPGDDGEGQQYVASFATIYNELLCISPQTLSALSKSDWPFSMKSSVHQSPQLLPGPVMFLNSSGPPICQLVLEPLLGESSLARASAAATSEFELKATESTSSIESASSSESSRPSHEEQKAVGSLSSVKLVKSPLLSQDKLDAITLVQKLAARNQYKLERQKGDIQFINNLSLLHARSAYNTNGSKGRHLQRMFLRDPKYAWPKPEKWAPYFDKPFENCSEAVIDHWDQNPEIAVFLHG